MILVIDRSAILPVHGTRAKTSSALNASSTTPFVARRLAV